MLDDVEILSGCRDIFVTGRFIIEMKLSLGISFSRFFLDEILCLNVGLYFIILREFALDGTEN